MNSIVNQFIRSLDKIENISDSYNVFKEIYSRHSPREWLDSYTVLDYSNAISRYRPDLLAVGIRLNVQVNLFLRTINIFDPKKLEIVGRDIGCFGLTEKGAGVLSGLQINTWYDESIEGYVLEPHINEYKNWISQGSTAEWILIFAKNRNGNNISIFLVKFRDIIENIERENKTGPIVCKYLDVAKIKIKSMIYLTRDSILYKTVDIDKKELLNGIYHGRWMISEAVLWSIYGLIEYCKGKIDNYPKLKILNNVINNETLRISMLIDKVTRNRKNVNNIDIVNCIKIYSVTQSIDSYINITKKMGSHILDYPLKYDDLLLNKIAEGDVDVLRLSLIHNDLKNSFFMSYLKSDYIYIWYYPEMVYNFREYLSDKIINGMLSKL